MCPYGESADVGASVFSFLGSEVRLRILDSLYERTVEPGPMADAASYSTIRADVGVEDSGRFSYHLDKLTDRFVTRHEDGYRLREPGREVVRLRRTGVLSDDLTVEFEPIDATCYRCDSTVEVGYDQGHLLTRCPDCPGLLDHELAPEGTLTALSYPPSGIESTDRETAFRRAHRRVEHRVLMMGSGFCPRCGGDVTTLFEPCDAETEPASGSDGLLHPGFTELACEHCGTLRVTHPLQIVSDREPVASLLAARDADPGWERFAELMRWPVTVDDGRIEFEAPDGSILSVSGNLEIDHLTSTPADLQRPEARGPD